MASLDQGETRLMDQHTITKSLLSSEPRYVSMKPKLKPQSIFQSECGVKTRSQSENSNLNSSQSEHGILSSNLSTVTKSTEDECSSKINSIQNYISSQMMSPSMSGHEINHEDNDEIVSQGQPRVLSNGDSCNAKLVQDSDSKLSSITEAINVDNIASFQNRKIDLETGKKLSEDFLLLQNVLSSRILNKASKPSTQFNKNKSLSKFQLPPVCGRSPPCFCPEDQLYAAKLRIRILKKISTLRRRHIRLRVILISGYQLKED